MTGNLLRLADLATVGVFVELRELAPQLSGLVYCAAAIPDKSLDTVLDWSAQIEAPDPARAFDLERLGMVFPALVAAFIASHTYVRISDRDVLELYDIGCGRLTSKIMGLTAQIAMAHHGDRGRALVEAARDDLASKLSKISDLIVGR